MTPSGLPRGIRDRIERLSLPAILAIAGFVVVGVGTGGYYAVQTYDYVQHDNDFCLSCHLMEEPYERFAQSEHRGLGCKACHRPNLIERSSMGLTQIVDNPDSLGIHAEVPNSVCADCHIEGDPEKWELIANSAGHRAHLESTDSVLEGLRCVECHSTSVHEFASVDRTCAQSSCHTESTIQLGAMGAFTIHCVACHEFNAATPGDLGAEAFADAMSPDQDTCLSCHAMRAMTTLPDPDPHDGTCASCHDPHTQTTPAEAVETCAGAGCHTDAESITPFHVGLEEEVLDNCLQCHSAHDFAVDGSNCLACHTGILQDDPALPFDAAWNAPLQERPSFLHSEHVDVDCASCHSSETRHGGLTVTTTNDCRSCHHTEPQAADCAACHVTSGSLGDPYPAVHTFTMSVADPQDRTLAFDHADHETQSCADCHTGGLDLSGSSTDCSSCHVDHHAPEASCIACHQRAPTEAHPVEQAHATCSAAGCHVDGPFDSAPRARQVCLGCHQDLIDHRPEEPNCAECHVLPDPVRGR